jgi:hypothetical protein
VGRSAVVLLLCVVSLAAVSAAGAAVDVRQMADDTVKIDNTVACQEQAPGNYSFEASYYRRFHLPNYGVTGPFTVTSVTFGIELATDGADSGQPMRVRMHTVPSGSPLLLANLTLDDFEELSIADGDAGSLRSAVFSRTITHPDTTDLVLELFQPDGVAAHNRLTFGSNDTPETGPTYIRSPGCNYFEPTRVSDPTVNFPNSHVILFATGDEGADVDPPNLGVKIPAGQTLAGAFEKGVKARLSSGEPCDLDVKLLISKKLANRLDIARVVGTAHRVLGKAGAKTVATDFTQRAKHALKGRHLLSLTVRAKATDAAANAKTVSKSVTL